MSVISAFDRGARHYDHLVGLNPGYHAALRAAASALVDRLAGRPRPWSLLDLACGSGASTRALADAAPDARVLGVDASEGMLGQARAKRWPETVSFAQGVCGRLDVAALGSGRHDGILTAYLLRNAPAGERDIAVAEMYDLLAPGGWLVLQEYSVRGNRPAAAVWTCVCWLAIIPLGLIVDRNLGLYRYLWRSVVEFDSTTTVMDRLARAGFIGIATRTAPGWQRGILHTYVAHKPGAGT